MAGKKLNLNLIGIDSAPVGSINEAIQLDSRIEGIVNLGNTSSGETLTPLSTILINDYTHTAQPGEHIAIQGAFSATATLCLYIGDNTRYLNIVPASTQVYENHMIVKIPSNLLFGEYKIFIKDDENRSNFYYINRAEPKGLDSKEIYSGGKMTLNGDNLWFKGFKPTVRFRDQTTGSFTPAFVLDESIDRHKLSFLAPTNIIAGRVYDIYVSNGFSAEEVAVDKPTGISGTTDVFNLETGWASRYTPAMFANIYNVKTDTRLSVKAQGNGSNNDRAAIQEAIADAAADGGGIVYLPPGTYNMGSSGNAHILTYQNNVVIKGAGVDLTEITFNEASTQTDVLYIASNVKNTGLLDIKLRNTDTGVVTFAFSDIQGDNFFAKNVYLDLKRADTFGIKEADNILLDNVITMPSGDTLNNLRGPIRANYCRNLTIRNCTITLVRSVNLGYTSSVFVYNNTFIRDGKHQIYDNTVTTTNPNTIVHVITQDFVERSYVSYNKFRMINGPLPLKDDGSRRNDDGECIISEGGGPNPLDNTAGPVASATATVTTLGGPAIPSGSFDYDPWIVITKGKGSGQKRYITAHTTSTVTHAAWDVIPDNTSRYVIGNWSLKDAYYVANEFYDQQRSYFLYHAMMHRVRIHLSKSVNSMGVNLVPVQRNTDEDVNKPKFTPAYDIEISGCTSDGATDGYNDGSHGVRFLQEKIPDTWGSMITNLVFRGGYVKNKTPSSLTTGTADDPYEPGFAVYVQYNRKTPDGVYYNGSSVPGIVNVIFENIVCKDLDIGVRISTGVKNVNISGVKYINTPVYNASQNFLNRINSTTFAAGAQNVLVLTGEEDVPGDPFPTLNIDAWGDSLTQGAGGTPYPTQLGAFAEMSGRTITNYGVGGDKSTQIAFRMGAITAPVTVAGNSIPASGAVTITANQINAADILQNSRSVTGTISGIQGTLARNSSGVYSFTRTSSGSATTVTDPVTFIPSTAQNTDITLICIGQNDTRSTAQNTIVMNNIAAMVSAIKTNPKRFLVLTVPGANASGSGKTALTALNNAIKSTYPNNHVDARGLLIAASSSGDQATDTISSALLSDAVHLNTTGYGIWAAGVRDAIVSRGW